MVNLKYLKVVFKYLQFYKIKSKIWLTSLLKEKMEVSMFGESVCIQ